MSRTQQGVKFLILFAGLLESPKISHEESLILAQLEDEIRKQLGVKYDQD
jgi:dihydrodiol dehydrogenase / D-xylose 1-dehydrogenase (NADP)